MRLLPAFTIAPAASPMPAGLARLALAIGCLVALSVPLLFLAVGYQGEMVRLETSVRLAADAHAHALVQPARTPGAARAGAGVVEMLSRQGAGSSARLLDAQGRVVAQVPRTLDAPVITRAATVVPGDAASPVVESSRSLRPLLLHSVVMLLPGVLLGWIAFIGLREIPMGAFRLALREADERKSAETRLAKSLSVFAATLESTADGILVTDVMGRAVVCNQRFLQLFQLRDRPRNDAAGGVDPEAMFAIATQLRDPTAFLAMQKDLDSRVCADHGTILELRDGRLVEWSSRPQNIDGVVVGRVSSFRDISERKRAESLLAAEKEVLEMVVCGTPLTRALGVLARHLEQLSGQMFCAILFREGGETAPLLVAAGPHLPRGFPEAAAGAHRAAIEAVFREVDALESGRPEALPPTHLSMIDASQAGEAWDDYRAFAGDMEVELGFAVAVRSTAGHLTGVILAHYRPGEAPPANDRDLIRVASHLTRIAIERRHAETQLRFLAHFDALTFLPNRDLFRDRLRQALAQSTAHGTSGAVMFIDLDRFKTINDTLGHDAGDLLLCEVANRLRRCVSEEDTVARLGGDEFTVICRQLARPDDAGGVASRIVEALSPPITINGRETFVTPSIGITVFPGDADAIETLLKNADTAMYRAKREGGNGYCFFDAAMNTIAEDKLALESGLRRALERGEFVVHYQPKQCLATGAIAGAEALLRWRHPERGLVAPGEFVPLLEETGLIEPVGRWVLRSVCEQIRAWQDQGLPAFPVAVNLSGRQLQHNDLARTIAEILEETGVAPRLLELEVTESMLMHDPDYAAQMLRQLRSEGVEHITVDDFGTGYSSLSYLKRFPINALKIDKSFIDGLPDDPDNLAITRAVIALGHSLKMKVIAEGVETEAQRATLEQDGCDLAQGYVVSPPVVPEVLAAMVRALPDGAGRPPRARARQAATPPRLRAA